MSDLMFESLLAEHNQAYIDARPFNNWMPDDGEYIVSVGSFDKGAKEDEKGKTGWMRLTVKIEAGESIAEVIGKEFDLAFFSPNGLANLKTAATTLNNGNEPGNLTEAVTILENSVGEVLRVKVETSTSTKTGKDYTNVYIQEVVAASDPATDNSAPPQEE